ncbi:MAG TPA: ribonuclease HII [Gammaproteobacteria bacterium]|nr:ribonuclease HII [Gammaproteobacteria bacterium]
MVASRINTLAFRLIAGVDEAGRGPLAGPVVAGAVVLDPENPIDGLKDSKQLSHPKREELFALIQERSLAWSVGFASVEEIDQINILQATMLAMKRAVEALKISPELALIDGNRCPQLDCESQAIIQGDAIEPAISAASIVAKVTRDREMMKLDAEFPQYGFAKHKGYSTKSHLTALMEHGPSRIHRISFAPVSSLVSK